MIQLLNKPIDQRIVLYGTWEDFKLLQKFSQNSPGVRVAFYDGEIELFMPGLQHEQFSEIIGYLVTTFLLKRGLIFVPSGSVTQEKPGEVAAQADKSYCLGTAKPIPDLSIEIVFTSGSVNKLARYRSLGVSEVWFWEDGSLKLYHLRDREYDQIARSELPGLENLDIELLKRCILIAETNFAGAVQLLQSES
ncbi:Uma2 family endonuclease [Leptolyngbya sp. FACHB-17]|uniref:Uma2 family endonuclease n=1 Tax=unclassified Leptolyngbya TaxID=2650499 RepID=UPI001681C160|nr:Uma2 family endonuclease [Leptolyngbya sp. FACHB-17]MBD2080668.1 Uma2 family endonuclease [Leptolyngbya sp. FACHB-17]